MGNDHLSKVASTNFLRHSGASKFRTLYFIQKWPKIGQFRPILLLDEIFTIVLAYYITRPFERDMNQLPATFRGFKISHTRFYSKKKLISAMFGRFRPKSASEENFTIFSVYYITRPFERDINQIPATFRGFKILHTIFDAKKS